MNDKPTLRRRHLCNQLSAVIAKLEELGCTPEQADRIVVAAATARVNAAYDAAIGRETERRSRLEPITSEETCSTRG